MIQSQSKSNTSKGNISMAMSINHQSRSSLKAIMNLGHGDKNSSTFLPTPWCDETDSGYSHEIARRSVARAALNLGIDSMSGDALDGLGDVLVSYLERIGQSMAAVAETSNRSSAHCNILDALDAIEMNMVSSNSGIGRSRNKFENLAEFAFGSEWKDKLVQFDTGIVQSRKAIIKEKEKQRIEKDAKAAAAAAATAAAAANKNTTASNSDKGQSQATNSTSSNSQQPPALVGHKKNGDKLKNLTQNNPHLASSLSSSISGMKQAQSNKNEVNERTKSGNASKVESEEKTEQEDDGAWNAPYLDVVPIYPLLRDASRLNTSIKIGSMMLATEDEACRGENDGLPGSNSPLDIARIGEKAEKKAAWDMDQFPSRNFFASFSNSSSSLKKENNGDAIHRTDTVKESTSVKKRTRFDETVENNGEPTIKRHKFTSTSNDSSFTTKNSSYMDANKYRPSYIPSFLPSFPPKHTYQVTATNAASNSFTSSAKRNGYVSSSNFMSNGELSIRRSLVLQQQHLHVQKQQQFLEQKKDVSLTVPSGNLSTMESQSNIHNDLQKKKDSARNGGIGSSITPLEKISVSKISKILEGSMDLYHCS